jgi:hypothetical protein
MYEAFHSIIGTYKFRGASRVVQLVDGEENKEE